MYVRPEIRADIPAVHRLNEAAFGRPDEAALVDALRAKAKPHISLVAEDEGVLVGHILFTPVKVPGAGRLKAMGLAPMAVLPTHQRRGVGRGLVTEGLRACTTAGIDAVFVLGHPDYYPRFGFRPAVDSNLSCAFPAPPEAFMVRELMDGCLAGTSGRVAFHPLFNSVA